MIQFPSDDRDQEARDDRRMRSLSRIFELTTSLLDVQDVSVLLKNIAESVREIFGFELVCISILDEERHIFTDHALAGYSEAQEREIRETAGSFDADGILSTITDKYKVSRISYFQPGEESASTLEEFAFIRNRDAAQLPRKSPESWHEMDLLYFALRNRRGEVVGYLQVDYPLDGKLPSVRTIEDIELFAGIAAVGIENYTMYKRSQDLLKENEVKTDRILGLLELMQSVIRIDDLDVVLQKISDVMAVTFGFRKAGVSLFSPSSNKVTVHALSGYTAEEEDVVRNSTILKEKVMEDFKEEFRVTRTGYYIPGETQGSGSGFVFMEDPGKAAQPRSTQHSWHELDLLYFAIFDAQGKMLGYIQLDYPTDGKIPTKETMEAMEVFASIATIAIENSTTYETLNATRDQVRMYLDLLTHDIGNLVNPIHAYLEIVIGNTSLDQMQHKYVSSALDASRSIIHLIRNVKRSAQMIEKSEVELMPVNMTKAIQRISVEAKGSYLSKDVKINLALPEQDVWVMADNFVDEVVYNLLTNSIKFDEHSEVVIDVDMRLSELENKSYAHVRVTDRAVGIPDDLKEKVFTQEFRKMAKQDRPGGQKSKGAGMGLSLVMSLVQRYGGKIWIENRVYDDFSKGSVFNLLLPKV